jgi:hypothetical protein
MVVRRASVQVEQEINAHSKTRHELDAVVGAGGRLENVERANERLVVELARLAEEREAARRRCEGIGLKLSEANEKMEEERRRDYAEREGERAQLQSVLESERAQHKTICERLAVEIEQARRQYQGRKEQARKELEGEEAKWKKAELEAVAVVEEEWRAKFGRLCTELKLALQHETEAREAQAEEERKKEQAKAGELLAGETKRAEAERKRRAELEAEVAYIRRTLVQDVVDESRLSMPIPAPPGAHHHHHQQQHHQQQHHQQQHHQQQQHYQQQHQHLMAAGGYLPSGVGTSMGGGGALGTAALTAADQARASELAAATALLRATNAPPLSMAMLPQRMSAPMPIMQMPMPYPTSAMSAFGSTVGNAVGSMQPPSMAHVGHRVNGMANLRAVNGTAAMVATAVRNGRRLGGHGVDVGDSGGIGVVRRKSGRHATRGSSGIGGSYSDGLSTARDRGDGERRHRKSEGERRHRKSLGGSKGEGDIAIAEAGAGSGAGAVDSQESKECSDGSGHGGRDRTSRHRLMRSLVQLKQSAVVASAAAAVDASSFDSFACHDPDTLVGAIKVTTGATSIGRAHESPNLHFGQKDHGNSTANTSANSSIVNTTMGEDMMASVGRACSVESSPAAGSPLSISAERLSTQDPALALSPAGGGTLCNPSFDAAAKKLRSALRKCEGLV